MCHVQRCSSWRSLPGPRGILKFVFPRFTQTVLCILYTLQLQRQVRYCVMLYVYSNTMRYTEHHGFGSNCATRPNTHYGNASEMMYDVCCIARQLKQRGNVREKLNGHLRHRNTTLAFAEKTREFKMREN